MLNIFQQPWTLLITAIVGWFILLLIHGDSRLWWQSHLVIFLAVAVFAVGFLVRVGLFKISNTMIFIIQVILCLAIAVLLTLQIIHIIQTYERHRLQWFLPIALAVAAFAFDFIVKTDLEKINNLISVARKAAEEEDFDTMAALISPDYSDSFHNTKDGLMSHCRSLLSEPLIEKTKKLGMAIDISSPKAEVIFTSRVHFEKQSHVYRNYRPFVTSKIRLDLQKEPEKRWLIHSTEILEIGGQPFGWRDIR